MALGRRDGDRQHVGDVLEPRPGSGGEAHVDVEDDLADDDQFVVERERIEREVDHPLRGVLDRDEPEVDLAGCDSVEHVGHGAKRRHLTSDQVGLRTKRLLGERTERPEEPDARWSARRVDGRFAGHGRRGYAPNQPRPVPFRDVSGRSAEMSLRSFSFRCAAP
jgi:hypothetical protein